MNAPIPVLGPSPCGSHWMRIAGVAAALRPSGALWLEDQRMLVVADLHLEKGSAYAARGQLLPPFDTRETLRRLCAEIDATDPAVVVFLGDTLHDRKAERRIMQEDADCLFDLVQHRRLIWIVGNHDADGPKALPGEAIDEIVVEGLVLRHEPRDGADHAWAAGHLHPAARVSGKGGTVRRRCFVTDGTRIVLPAFGAYAGGLNVRDKAFAGLFSREPFAVALGSARCHPVTWRRLAAD